MVVLLITPLELLLKEQYKIKTVLKIQKWFRRLLIDRDNRVQNRVRSKTPDLIAENKKIKKYNTWYNELPTIVCQCDGTDLAGNPLINRKTDRCTICMHLIGGRYDCLPSMCCKVTECVGCGKKKVNSNSNLCGTKCEDNYC